LDPLRAATLSLYMLVKATWVAVALLSHKPTDREMTTAAFVTLNTVTIGIAVIGVTLGLGLASDWGRHDPSCYWCSCRGSAPGSWSR
jgi:hypothetical protein